MTRARELVARANGRPRVISGGWKKTAPAPKGDAPLLVMRLEIVGGIR